VQGLTTPSKGKGIVGYHGMGSRVDPEATPRAAKSSASHHRLSSQAPWDPDDFLRPGLASRSRRAEGDSGHVGTAECSNNDNNESPADQDAENDEAVVERMLLGMPGAWIPER
jgi:hypothetical protein